MTKPVYTQKDISFASVQSITIFAICYQGSIITGPDMSKLTRRLLPSVAEQDGLLLPSHMLQRQVFL